MSDDTLNLTCLVLGVEDPAYHTFPIQIVKEEQVSTLQEMIKAKRQRVFRGADAADLALWKVSIPIDDTLKATLHSNCLHISRIVYPKSPSTFWCKDQLLVSGSTSLGLLC